MERVRRITQGVEIALCLTHTVYVSYKSLSCGFNQVISGSGQRDTSVGHLAIHTKRVECAGRHCYRCVIT